MISYAKLLLPAIALFLISGCDTTANEADSLGSYVASSLLPFSDQLIACAGGTEVVLDDIPFFNGYLRRFRNIPIPQEKWARVTFETGDSLHVSNAIRLKYPVLPTTYDSSKVIVELNGTNPTFSWPDHNNSLDVIYFQVVSDRNGNLISGTYTFDKAFTFYDLSNVVLNIRDVSPAPSLDIGEPYKFTLMTVSGDNWVNLISERNFIVE